MTLTRTGLTLALTACTLPCFTAAQTITFTDPANLRGERVRPSDGRELPVDQGASGLQQMLRKLNTRASLMLIVAHPDDEDGGMLTFYSRGLGARVAVLTLNRGEGGQNAMTGDFEDALGLLRTQELLSADRYFDVDQMFGTEVDFGFSKTKEEAFAKWTHQRVLYDAVRAVRLYRPLVIASVFVGGVTDGHGQHQVSGEIAQEVFKAAGDPKVFPALTAEGILPWQPLKVYARVPMQSITDKGLFDYATGQYTPAKFTNYVTGEVTTTEPSVDVVVHEGTPDPLLDGKSYVQFARIGLGLQRSQIGPGVRNAPPGAFDISYHRYGSHLDAAHQKPREESFFDGIDTSIEGIENLAPHLPMSFRAGLKDLSTTISLATAATGAADSARSPDNIQGRELIALPLADALKRTDALISGISASSLSSEEKVSVLHELRIKRVQLNDALVFALGLSFDATSPSSGGDIYAGSAPTVDSKLIGVAKSRWTLTQTWVANAEGKGIGDAKPFDSGVNGPPTSEQPLRRTVLLKPEFTHIVTRPYFHRDSIEQPFYNLDLPALRNAPTSSPAMVAWAYVRYQDVNVEIGSIVHDGVQPVRFVTPASLTLSAHAQAFPSTEKAVLFSTFLYPLKKPAIEPKIPVPDGWRTHIALSDVNSPGQMSFELEAPASHRDNVTLKVAAALPNGESVTGGYRSIGYGNLPRTNYYIPATLRVVPVDLKLPTHDRIAYLPGTGDAVPEALASISLTPDTLTVADLTPAKLAQYDTVILGVRTYNAHPDLHGAPTQALLDYARNGGNVIVQFQTPEFTAADAPFPLTLGRAEVVVDETTPVQILVPDSPVFTTPNKITPADFNNWVEERGHGFLRSWDSHYTALTETHDPGQAPQLGGLVTTSLGKGHWTYCAFALYRQLPEAVPGAYRLFINLLNP